MDDLFDLDDFEGKEINEEDKEKEIENNKEEKNNIKEEKEKENDDKKEIIKEEENDEKKEIIKENKEEKKEDKKNEIKKKDIVYALEDKIDIKKYDEINLAMTFPFELDDFQKRGIIRVENHENVLVCAHTSSGKTIVAEYGIAYTRRKKKRIIYTAPIKALSNQKYRDFKEKFDDVGVVTGDVSINPDAQCLIMTTEILQNMLYRQSEKLQQVDYVIFDEVHYINDTERGHVWEEILILLPPNIGLIMLSATIPNYLDFAKWIGSIKKATIYIENTYKRVVPLEHKIYINSKNVFTILDTSKDNGKVNQEEVYNALKFGEAENEKISKKKNDYQSRQKRKQRQQKIADQIKTFQKFLVKRQQEEFNEKYSKVENVITQTHFKIEEMANYIQKQNLFPAVMFTFSIKKIDEYARMLSKTQFNNQGESSKIISFFDKCISKLSPYDRNIGQVQSLRQLLPTGVGVHHSGLLPILKECVEILYSKGLIKILFATTSFSIGLNMPTRTVVFTDITKFNNDKKEILSSSEYLQMCGRAGRRGKDDKGYVFILIADKNAKLEPTKVIGMASGSGSIVKSQFRLSYKVIINFFYRNVKNIMQFFKESYIENSNFISMTEIKKKIEELTEKQKNLKKIDCKNEIETISEYYSSSVNLRQYRNKLFSNQYIKPLFKTQGRIILYNSKKSLKNIYVLVVNHYTDYDGEIWCLRVDGDENVVTEFENSKERKLKINQGQFAQKGIKNGKYFSYFSIFNEDVVDICDFTLNCLSKKKSAVGELIADDDGFEFYLDKNLNIILDELLNINKDLDNNKSQIKVVNYLKVCRNDIDVSQYIKEKEKLELIQISNPCHQCLLRENHNLDYKSNKVVLDELEKNKKKLSEENLRYFKEFQMRIKILKNLGYIDEENNLTLKGKAAREITCCDCLIVTELLFSNILDKLSIEETTAFLSCFILNKNEISFEDPEISEEFTKAIEELKKINNSINEQEMKLNFQESNYNRKIDFSISYTIKCWMEGKHFNEILEECDLEEGKVYSIINRLSGFYDSICEFYNVLGNKTLGEKFVKAKSILLRDIMTSKSLYLQDDLNLSELD